MTVVASRQPRSKLPAEAILLLACLQWSPSETPAIQSIGANRVDWAFFLKLVKRHRVSALVEHALRPSAPAIDDAALAYLQGQANLSSWRELALLEEMRAMQIPLVQAGLRPVLLKGLAFSIKAFGQLGVRYHHDIDWLICPGALDQAGAVMLARGYERIEPKTGSGLEKSVVFQHPVHGHLVEMHTRLFDNLHLMPLRAGMPHATIRISGDVVVETLEPEFDLIFACVHGAQHAWSRLKWLADVAAMFQPMSETQVIALYEYARSLRVHRAVAQALMLCGKYLHLPVPAAIAAEARRSWRTRLLVRMAEQAMFGSGSEEIADRRFGSTLANLSHYLISDGLDYWADEMKFDLTDLTRDPPDDLQGFFRPFVRIARWFRRQAGLAPNRRH
jgi:hypothetical protein